MLVAVRLLCPVFLESGFSILDVDDVLKIDMAFIRKMNDNPKNKEIIKLIIDITHRFNAINVAEGVESEDHYLFLKENGCDVIQGYYFSKPLPQADFEELLKKE